MSTIDKWILFLSLVMFAVWLTLDSFRIVETPLVTANHWIPEFAVIFLFGMKDGFSKNKSSAKQWIVWFFVLQFLLAAVLIGLRMAPLDPAILWYGLGLIAPLFSSVYGSGYLAGRRWRRKDLEKSEAYAR